MPETGNPPKQEEGRALAAGCYVPFFFINWICILYTLIAKKDWDFGRFHAAQAAVLNVTYFIAMGLLAIIVYGAIMLAVFFGIFSVAGAAASQDAGAAAIGPFLLIFAIYGVVFIAVATILLLWAGYILYSLYLAVNVLSGNNPRIPKLAKITDGLLGGNPAQPES